ncbi:hypothetical protein DFH06DRAFT_662751 [Mycena polygramma]|nr:hypothetical protein DFH06DRAFT_662751 [Mycena polygramma]
MSQIVPKCLGLLASIFRVSRGTSLLHVAILNGLIPTILACAQRRGTDASASDTLQGTLRNILVYIRIPASVHYHILQDLATADFASAEMGSENDFWRPDVEKAWLKFRRLVEVRLKVLKEFDCRASISRGACDNMECGIILDKNTLRRCSGCQELLYCSQHCQSGTGTPGTANPVSAT